MKLESNVYNVYEGFFSKFHIITQIAEKYKYTYVNVIITNSVVVHNQVKIALSKVVS